VKDILSEWTGQKLAYTSIYGIRVYKEHAILAPHVGTFLIRILLCSKELYDL
jgi:hypothetical protein